MHPIRTPLFTRNPLRSPALTPAARPEDQP